MYTCRCRPARAGRAAPRRSGGPGRRAAGARASPASQSAPSRSGPEVADQRVLVRGRHQVEHAEPVARPRSTRRSPSTARTSSRAGRPPGSPVRCDVPGPSIRRWVCRVSGGSPSTRDQQVLAAGDAPRAPSRPARSTVASDGPAQVATGSGRAGQRRVQPVARSRQTMSPSGIGAAQPRRQARSRRPRGVAWKPAASSAGAERVAGAEDPAPSARSTVSRPSSPGAHGERPARRPPAAARRARR